jgi:hypothetical protein
VTATDPPAPRNNSLGNNHRDAGYAAMYRAGAALLYGPARPCHRRVPE